MGKNEVFFVNQNKIVFAEDGEILSDVCDRAGYPLDLVCGGKGTCGKCKVTIEIDEKQSEVLACLTKVNRNISVYLTKNDIKKDAKILSNGIKLKEYKGCMGKKDFEIDKYKVKHCGNYFDQIKIDDSTVISLDNLMKFSNLIKKTNDITVIYENNEVLDVREKTSDLDLYGAAVDIGTTTVVMFLYNITNFELMGVYSATNGQTSVGADVISRILYASNDDGLKQLNDKIIKTINQLIDKAEETHKGVVGNLYKMILCGNSTMQQLFLNLNPENLGTSPFLSVTQDLVKGNARELNIKGNNNMKFEFLPLIGGFVGGDTVSVLASLGDTKENKLVIDLGTNGELAIGKPDKYLVASTACGPALEGAGISCGMRGTEGAIERFKILDDEIKIDVIGNSQPTGICGSGIVDIISELLDHNFIDRTGKLLDKEEYIAKHGKIKLADNLMEIDGIKSFLINRDGNKTVYINQKDIRQIQLAKSAIVSGCKILIKESGLREEEISEIVLSGAFGNYINIKNAVKIGLLPNIKDIPIESIGNGAGLGVQKYLLSKETRSLVDKIKENSQHIELSMNREFQNEYISNMHFE